MTLTKLALLLICACLFLSTCSTKDTILNSNIFDNDTIQIRFDQVIQIDNSDFSIHFSSIIHDYRFPLHLQIYDTLYNMSDNGMAQIELDVTGINGKVRIPIDGAPADSVGKTDPGKPVKIAGLVFKLIDLTPLRVEWGQTIPDTAYTATIVIEVDTTGSDTTSQVNQSTYFPIQFGNSWSYTDTFWLQDTFSRSQSYDINVEEQFHDMLGTWIQLSRGVMFLYSEDYSIMLSGDSILFRQSGWLREYGTIGSYPMFFYKTPGPTIDTTTHRMEGDMLYQRYARRIADTSIVVPAGEFRSVYEYYGPWAGYDSYKVYIAPGVGIIYVEGTGRRLSYKSYLTNYTLLDFAH